MFQRLPKTLPLPKKPVTRNALTLVLRQKRSPFLWEESEPVQFQLVAAASYATGKFLTAQPNEGFSRSHLWHCGRKLGEKLHRYASSRDRSSHHILDGMVTAESQAKDCGIFRKRPSPGITPSPELISKIAPLPSPYRSKLSIHSFRFMWMIQVCQWQFSNITSPT